MATGIKNFGKVEEALKGLVLKGVSRAEITLKEVSLVHFRIAVWALFQELVYTTPQFTGKAAANWNIGLGAPDLSVDDSLGERPEDKKAKDGHAYQLLVARHVGDRKWAEESIERNRFKPGRILTNTRVFISNAVQGDDDEGGPMGTQSEYYLAALQSPGYWAAKLREENAGAMRVQDVLLSQSWRGRMHLKGDGNNQDFGI